ncbi:hypothetical protein ATO8_12031 [Roseivivax marinus]|uniref:Type I secretion target repeat-containing protein n=1 Tax=Roseivivax marinus TaxID=1379903 RepID=W4HHQ3_9RHOB|nr:type I secretion protein [Roseivivax marinus]ETW12277.1 hypothetical protein ATO8_12031 [Roseivivax marinus]
MRAVLIPFLCLLALPAAVAADAPRALYVWGNSLVDYPDVDRASVPYWLGRMTEAEGRALSIDGQWGFLREFPDMAVAAEWQVEGVARLGSGDLSDYDAAILAPTNFIQYQPPGADYHEGDESPLDVTLAQVDRHPEDQPVLIYEGWADMGDYGFPPDRRAERRYHAANRGDYHDWHVDYLAELRASRPDRTFGLIPVAPVLSELLTGPLQGLEPELFYVDDAPHGTENTYALAALVVHASLYGEVPGAFAPPATLADEVRAAWPQILRAVEDGVARLADVEVADRADRPETRAESDEAPEHETRRAADAARSGATVQPGTEDAAAGEDRDEEGEEVAAALARIAPEGDPLPPRPEVTLPPAGAEPDGAPALAFGLNGISDWSTQHPFIDLMKTSRPWIGHLPDQWGGVSTEELRAGGHLDAQGWPVRIPEGVARLETFILTDQPEAAEHLRGAYLLTYDGTGTLEVGGRARRVWYLPNEVTFHYAPGDGPVGIAITETDPDDPIRNIQVVRRDYMRLPEVGALFNPLWLDRIEDARAVRFMDWMMTNGSTAETWDDRPRMDDATWAEWGVPVEAMVRLANRVGADPWFTMPHRADDGYVRAFAGAVRDGLDPDLRAYVEYSNEVWNFTFPQARWAAERAREKWGESDTGWMQYYGLRAAQVMDLWSEVFGDAAGDRLVRVASTQTGWPGLEENVLTAPLAFLELGRPPSESFDAYAVTGYFGYEAGEPEAADVISGWLDRAEAAARAEGEAGGLSRVALREYVDGARFEPAFGAMARAIREGSLATLTKELFPYHARVAEAAGLDLIMYEGGTHAAAQGEFVGDARYTDFLAAFSYSPEMAALYQEALDGWLAAGGRLFNAFVDVAPPSKWGSWGALRHLDDANPRWDVLMAHNASAPVDWQPRAADAFDGGMLRAADEGGETLTGRAGPDILLGGPGDDVLRGGGGDDRLHGGLGRDRAVLPGARPDWRFDEDGPRLVATRGDETVVLFAVEEMIFADAPDDVIPTN